MGWWPHVRAVLIGLHIFAVITLSLPSSGTLLQRRNWDLPSTQRAFTAIAARLHWLGIDSSKEFEDKLWGFTERYVRVRDTLAKPFVYYAELAGVREGWRMFSRPRERPIALEIAVDQTKGFQPIYRPHSEEYDFWAGKFRQYRMRAVTGGFARKFDPSWYDPLARLIATKAAEAYPDARRIRVRLREWTTLPPARVRAGDKPEGKYKHSRFYLAKALR